MKSWFPLAKGFRRMLVALAMVGASAVILQILRAQPNDVASAATNSAPPAAGSNAAPAAPAETSATNAAASTNMTTAATAPTSAGETNAAPATGVTNAPSSEMEGPPPPGEISTPGSEGSSTEPGEMIGPPAPGQFNAPAGPGGETEGAMPGNNPAVTDVTNQPGAVAGLGQRRLPFYFGLNVGEMYDSNSLITPDAFRTRSFITHISPSIDYQEGDQTAPHMNYLNVYFSPTFFIYDNENTQFTAPVPGLNAYPPLPPTSPLYPRKVVREGIVTSPPANRANYTGDIYYQYNWTRLSVGLDQNYQYSTDPFLDSGGIVSRNNYTTKLTASYLYNDNLTLYGTGTQAINSYPGFTLNEWDADLYALYELAPKLQLGAGPRFSYLDIQGSPNETHEDFLFRLKYVPDTKITVSFDGGIEYLQYQGSVPQRALLSEIDPATGKPFNVPTGTGNTPSRLLPVFDMNVTYSPLDDTQLFISAGRSTQTSYDLRGDTIEYTSVQTGVSQHFLQNYVFTATAGYSLSDYNDVTSDQSGQGVTVARSDNYLFGKGSVEWNPNQWLSVQGTYEWSKNESTLDSRKFSDNQIDIQSTVKF